MHTINSAAVELLKQKQNFHISTLFNCLRETIQLCWKNKEKKSFFCLETIWKMISLWRKKEKNPDYNMKKIKKSCCVLWRASAHVTVSN